MFFALMFALMAGGSSYVLYRLWHMIPPIAWLRWTVVLIGIVALTAGFAAILAGDSFPIPLTAALYKVGTSWLFIMLYLVMIFLVMDLLRVTHLVPVQKIMYGSWPGVVVLTALVAVIFIAGNITYHNKKRVEFTIDTGGKLEHPFKIVAASDLHLGYGIGNRELARWVRMINAENPDVVLIAGDVIDNSVRPLVERATAGVLAGLKADYGVFMSPGNHEYISGINVSRNFLNDAGLVVLRDSSVLVGGSFHVVGRDDMTNRARKELHELTEGLDVSKPVILLDHQPLNLERLRGEGVTLQISGHTHRGQVWPISWITDAIFEKSHGRLEKDGTTVYVSSGLGIWGGKFRIGTRSEYVVITLR